MSEALIGLLQCSLAASGAILIVMLVRKPCRLAFGAQTAYAVWLIVPIAAVASLTPVRPADLPVSLAVSPAPIVAAAEQTIAQAWTWGAATGTTSGPVSFAEPAAILGGFWLAGALLMAAWLMMKQLSFCRLLAQGLAGPAVVGVFNPRIVTPADFMKRFDAHEQALVIAHEQTHLACHHSRINGLVALARCIFWFNPLAHIAARLMQIDQELACDAGVIARHPRTRARYAETLLKSQLAAVSLPLGCHWPAGGEHPLTERIAMLDRPDPSRLRRIAGGMLVFLIATGAACGAWATAPVAAPAAEAPLALVEGALSPETASPRVDPRDVDELGRPRYGRPFAERFDAEALMNIQGVVVRIDWLKPNSALWVYGRAIDKTGADLGEKLWRIEGGNPLSLAPEARAASEAALGREVAVRGYGMKDKACEPNCWINGRSVTYANGEALVPADLKASEAPCTLKEVVAYTCPGAGEASPIVSPPTAQEIATALAKAGKTAGRFDAPPVPVPFSPKPKPAASAR